MDNIVEFHRRKDELEWLRMGVTISNLLMPHLKKGSRLTGDQFNPYRRSSKVIDREMIDANMERMKQLLPYIKEVQGISSKKNDGN